MARIESKTILTEANRICPVLRARGENLGAEHTATIVVRTLLAELGDELLDLTDEGSKIERARLVRLIKPFMTASKNFQNTYCAETIGADGKPLMPKVQGAAAMNPAEFA
jgi:hypothetical protein